MSTENEKKKEKLLAEFKTGTKSHRQLSEELNIPLGTLWVWKEQFREKGLLPPKTPHNPSKYDDEIKLTILEEIEAGKSMQSVAAAYGVTYSVVWNWHNSGVYKKLKRANKKENKVMTVTHETQYSELFKRQVINALEEGETFGSIEERFNIPIELASQWFTSYKEKNGGLVREPQPNNYVRNTSNLLAEIQGLKNQLARAQVEVLDAQKLCEFEKAKYQQLLLEIENLRTNENMFKKVLNHIIK